MQPIREVPEPEDLPMQLCRSRRDGRGVLPSPWKQGLRPWGRRTPGKFCLSPVISSLNLTWHIVRLYPMVLHVKL